MPLFRVKVTFDRKNMVTGRLEKNSVRESEFSSTDVESAREGYLARVKRNEPTLVKVNKVDVRQII